MMNLKKLHLSALVVSLLSLGILSINSPISINASHIHKQPNTIKINHMKHINISSYGQKVNIKHKKTHHQAINEMNYINAQVKHHQQHKRMTKTAIAPINEQGIKINYKPIQINYHKMHRHNWFRDGLNNSELNARQKIVALESGGNWNILSYGHRCIGYFQLDPAYLGYKNGHVNLNHRHQVKVADRYVAHRYGSWNRALQFHYNNNWY